MKILTRAPAMMFPSLLPFLLFSTTTTAILLSASFILIKALPIDPRQHSSSDERDMNLSYSARNDGDREYQIRVKVTLFIDTSLHEHLSHQLKMSQDGIMTFGAAYVGQMDAIFASLASDKVKRIEVALEDVKVEKYPGEFEGEFVGSSGNIDVSLGKFCLYQASQRLSTQSKSDFGLMLTRKDIYSEEETKMSSRELSYSTMGISPLMGINWPDLSCSIVEFGVGYDSDNLQDSTSDGRVYPTRGFGSAWIAAHELAHNLGLRHDESYSNEACSVEVGQNSTFMMSASSYIKSLSYNWSRCSSESLDHLGLWELTSLGTAQCYGDVKSRKFDPPGQLFDSQAQCSFFAGGLVVDNRAGTDTTRGDICGAGIKCASPTGRSVLIGPALEGTSCSSDGSICIQGFCEK